MNSTKSAERFRLCRCVGGYRIEPLAPMDRHPLLLALCNNDPRELARVRKGELPRLVGELMVQASRHGLLIEAKGRFRDPVLHLTRVDRLEATATVASPFERLPGRYAAHWGFLDMYPEHRRGLAEVLERDIAFDTGVFGVKKEIEYARVRRDGAGAPLQLWVRCEADDGVALADTAFWAAAGGNGHCGSGEDALLQLGVLAGVVEGELAALANEAEVSETNDAIRADQLPASATLDDVLTRLDELASAAEQELEDRYQRMLMLARARLAVLGGSR